MNFSKCFSDNNYLLILVFITPKSVQLKSLRLVSILYLVKTVNKSKMKYLKLVLVLLLFTDCQAQSKNLLVNKGLISNWSKYSFYTSLIKSKNGLEEWKE